MEMKHIGAAAGLIVMLIGKLSHDTDVVIMGGFMYVGNLLL